MNLTPTPFAKIANGTKIIESRLYDEKRQLINIGDILEFSNTENNSVKIKTKIIALYRYGYFKDLFNDFPASYFGGESADQLYNEVKNFYSPEQEKEFGVLGIRLKKID